MAKHSSVRLKALVDQNQAQEAANTSVIALADSPIILDSLKVGPMPIALPATISYPTPSRDAGATLVDPSARPSLSGRVPIRKPSAVGVSVGNVCSKSMVPGPNGGAVGVESLDLNPEEEDDPHPGQM